MVGDGWGKLIIRLISAKAGALLCLAELGNIIFSINLGKIQKMYVMFESVTRLSYYNVTTRLVDLVGLCQLKQNLV